MCFGFFVTFTGNPKDYFLSLQSPQQQLGMSMPEGLLAISRVAFGVPDGTLELDHLSKNYGFLSSHGPCVLSTTGGMGESSYVFIETFLIVFYVHTHLLGVYGVRLSSVLCFSLTGKVLTVVLLILFILLGIGKERVYKQLVQLLGENCQFLY